MAVRRQRAPWLTEGEPERWISPSRFARLVNRKPVTIYYWLARGDVLPHFGYRSFQDCRGKWFIQVPKSELFLTEQLHKSSKAYKVRQAATSAS